MFKIVKLLGSFTISGDQPWNLKIKISENYSTKLCILLIG